MKKIICKGFFATIMLTLSFSCNKDKVSACSNGNLCFRLGSQEIAVDAVRMELPANRYRLYWEESNGANYRNIEIDIYGSSEGSYTFSQQPGAAGTAGFQYFVNNGGNAVNTTAVSGTLTLVSAGSGGWSGTFEGTVNDGSSDLELSNGNFSDVQPE